MSIIINIAGDITQHIDPSEFEIISQDEFDACQKEFVTDGLQGCQRSLPEKLEEWKEIPLNVAVIGNSGVGKSSFINAIRCVFDVMFTHLKKTHLMTVS